MTDLRPEVQAVLDANAAMGLRDFAEMTATEAREVFLDLRVAPPDLVEVHSVDDRPIPGPDSELMVRIHRPSAEDDLPVLVWFHGGGWVLGDLESGDLPGRHLAAAAGCVVVSVDYRLAPEHVFPAAFDDCMATTEWVIANAEQLGIDASRVAVGGDSAGGNLAACVAVEAERRGIELRHQLLVYPVIADDFSTPSYQQFATGHFLTLTGMEWFWNQYTSPSDRADPRVAPMHGELTGQPSAWIYLAGCDPLCSEGRQYGDALTAAGVTVEIVEVPGVIHGVFSMTLDCGSEARDAGAASLREAFSR